MGQGLDDIDELLEDFETELRHVNKSQGTIDPRGGPGGSEIAGSTRTAV